MNDSADEWQSTGGSRAHGLYLTFVLFQQPTSLAGAHFHTSILAHHLSTSIQLFLQVGNEDPSDLPS